MPGKRLMTLVLAGVLLAAAAHAAFYRYRDATGQYVFVDDLDKVPQPFKDTVRKYPEAVDTMTDEERKAFDAENARRAQHQRQQYLQHVKNIREKSGIKAPAQETAPATTAVRISNNQVLVPVKMGYRGVETEVILLLDTGANVTTVHKEVADALGLRWARRGSMKVVGGQRIRAGLGELSHITLGTLKLDNVAVGIITHKGAKLPFDGLLGMNVLGRVEFHVDMKNSTITWKHRTAGGTKTP